jgi:hypothetical protein
MSQSLDFRITARDQASAVVASVQKKVADFGKDIGRSIVAIAGPMALATMAISKVTEKMEEARQKAKDAFNWGSGLQRSAQQMGVSVSNFQRIEGAATETGQSVSDVGAAFKAASDLIDAAKRGNLAAAESIAAMGLDLENLESIKPEDVIRAIGEAMDAATDPADKLRIAIGALGKEGEKLQGVLAKGFDIAGALSGSRDDDLTDQEAEVLAKSERDARTAERREKVAAARREAARKFIEGGGGKDVINEFTQTGDAQARRGGTFGMLPGNVANLGGPNAVVADLLNDPKFVARLLESMKPPVAPPPRPSAVAAAADLGTLADERDKKDEKGPKDKPDKAKPSVAGMEFSSLRAIGGAMAGDSSIRGTEEERTEIARQIRDRLDKLIEQNQPSIDFTKNIGRAFAPIGRIFNK